MAGLFERFLENIRQFGLEYYGRYYGTYRGIVVSNIDETNRGLIFVSVPAISGDDVLAYEAFPKMPFAGADHGMFFPPEEGETIYVQFENGGPQFPIYEGGWWKSPNDTAGSVALDPTTTPPASILRLAPFIIRSFCDTI